MANEPIPNLKGVKIGNMSGSTTQPIPTQKPQSAPQQSVPQQATRTTGRAPKSEMEQVIDTTVKAAARSFGSRLVTALMKNLFKSKK